MKVTKEKLENSQVLLKIEAEPGETEKYLDQAYRRVVNRVLVPGFRKGKTPRHILERHVGKEALLQEAMEKMVPELYQKARVDQGVEPVEEPDFHVTSTDPVTFDARISVKPTVELGDYRSIRIPVETVEVKNEDVDSYVENLREANALWEPVARPVATGDSVTVDLEVTVDGKKKIDQKGLQLPMIKDTPVVVPGLAEQVIGMAAGEEKEFEIHVPEDFKGKELSGKDCQFKVRVNEIKEKKLADMNDEFARSLNWGLETIDALKDKAREDLRKVRESVILRGHETQVLEAAVAASKVEYPLVLVERQIDELVRDRVRYSGTDSLESYLANVKKTQEDLKEEVREQALRRILNTIVLHEISEQEKVEVTDEEIDAEINSLVKVNAGRLAAPKLDEVREQLNTAPGRESIKNSLRQRKTLELLSRMALSAEAAGSGEKPVEKVSL